MNPISGHAAERLAAPRPHAPTRPGIPGGDIRPGRAGSGHLLTVAIEDYFQVAAFKRVIQQGHWSRFEQRIEHGVRNTLDLLDRHNARATFFVLGWIAEQFPELVRSVGDRGHEVASKGYFHRPTRWLTRTEFTDDLARAEEAITKATGRRVLGYRMADGWLGPDDYWVLELLAERGYRYDSSVAPLGFGQGSARRATVHRCQAGDLWEFPISSAEWLGFTVPVAGGNYLRQLPEWLTRRAIDRQAATNPPLVLYFHTWELDPSLPRISGAPWYQQIRTYRNLDRMANRLSSYLGRHRFESIAEHLGIAARDRPLKVEASTHRLVTRGGAVQASTTATTATPMTIVVPCYNEEVVLPFLANTLDTVIRQLAGYQCRLVFVDDGSTDGTWAGLEKTFGAWERVTFVRHDRNLGLAAGIRTGLTRADTEIVCTIDCDCSYDPAILREMLPMLTDGIDLVTASPYHGAGQVRNVPTWRLALSRGASWLYRRVLGLSIRTYTSCVRVYRRQAVLALPHRYGGYLGVAETIGRLALAGGGIAEYPATLEARLLGRSKMKAFRTMLGHLRLLGELSWLRLRRHLVGRGTP